MGVVPVVYNPDFADIVDAVGLDYRLVVGGTPLHMRNKKAAIHGKDPSIQNAVQQLARYCSNTSCVRGEDWCANRMRRVGRFHRSAQLEDARVQYKRAVKALPVFEADVQTFRDAF